MTDEAEYSCVTFTVPFTSSSTFAIVPSLSAARTATKIEPINNSDPAVGEVIDTVGATFAGGCVGGGFTTLTRIAVDIAELPAASVARAVKVCWPRTVAFQVNRKLFGSPLTTTARPNAAPLRKISTVTGERCGSRAVTVNVTAEFRLKLEPLSGEMNCADGGVVSCTGGAGTTTLTAADVAEFPAASTARALKACVPAALAVHTVLY